MSATVEPVLAAARRLVDTALGTLETRLRLFATECEAEGLYAVRFVAYLALALVALVMAIVAACALLVVVFWDTHRLAALGGVTIAFIVLACGLAWRMRALARASDGSHAQPGRPITSTRIAQSVSLVIESAIQTSLPRHA
mgnify:CR=1 FL=1